METIVKGHRLKASNPYVDGKHDIANIPKDKKAKHMLWDSYGFALAAVFLITSYYWVPSLGTETHIFVFVTSVAFALGGVLLAWKSQRIEETKLSYGAISLNLFIVIYMAFTLALGLIVSSALSGVDFTF